MTIYTTTEARKNIYKMVDETNKTHMPIYIKGKRNSAVLISEDDYESLRETMHIYSVPNLVKEILEASKEPIEECVEWTDDV